MSVYVLLALVGLREVVHTDLRTGVLLDSIHAPVPSILLLHACVERDVALGAK